MHQIHDLNKPPSPSFLLLSSTPSFPPRIACLRVFYPNHEQTRVFENSIDTRSSHPTENVTTVSNKLNLQVRPATSPNPAEDEDGLRFWMERDKDGTTPGASAEVLQHLAFYGPSHAHLYTLVLRFLTSQTAGAEDSEET
ncbi:hypothetical protein EV360DRAFT_90484 [Lentinula raphanica]|nr:hypothetical protein EV360DRAFT_90484 [Lentinula raphanica]